MLHQASHNAIPREHLARQRKIRDKKAEAFLRTDSRRTNAIEGLAMLSFKRKSLCRRRKGAIHARLFTKKKKTAKLRKI